MKRSEKAVRIGPISLFTLLAVLCLAVMTVLTVTTANATYAMAQRQATGTSDGYLVESSAQSFLSDVDATLVGVRNQGASQQAAVSAVSAALPSLASKVSSGVKANASMDGNIVRVSFVSDGGKVLDVALTISDSATYKISQWKMTTQSDEGTNETLWSGTKKDEEHQ